MVEKFCRLIERDHVSAGGDEDALEVIADRLQLACCCATDDLSTDRERGAFEAEKPLMNTPPVSGTQTRSDDR